MSETDWDWKDIKKSRGQYFPESFEEWVAEDHALAWLLDGLRIVRRGKNQTPRPLMIYGTAIRMYFEWIEGEALGKGNQAAADRIYYLAHFAVAALRKACFEQPNLFRPLAKQQLFWPSIIGKGTDFDRTNEGLMESLSLGENAPLNTARKGRKSFSQIENPATRIAFGLWTALEYFRREEQAFMSADPVCSIVMPDLPGICNPHRLGLTPDGEKKLKILKPLSRQNYVEWWKIAEPAFIHRYGEDFEEHPDFSAYSKKGGKLSKNEAKKPRGLVRREIKKAILQAFKSIAPQR